ncbi:hypothetical protein [Pseudomonas aeruginosa]|uniref:hypothetical protein n=1 Tax=Pseudomonas aeruginosa TaxID=287 RepID=UPI000EB344C4|nr:hypothetical protein [Pseudomonas aeruginosa]MCO2938287.1 hypothetical protein [Pseudomonas aeruginosa]HBN8610182.1 hypothetical protein [Pseudomonas aeruginosa]HBN9749336.1 hypothetical protein [Pseudomonas aeruginosa]HCF4751178.1 hypothetical protein [Pseudomonas aeruginosa]
MPTQKNDCDNELFLSLRKAFPEEVDVLVDIITDFARGRAGLDADDKKTLVQAKHASRPNGYSDDQLKLLGYELQQFGGHSAFNLARRLLQKPAIGYTEIVNDVYRKLNGDQAKHKSMADKEREIALALFGENWRELPPKERFERSTSIKVLSGLFKMKDALPLGRTGALVGLSAANSAALFTVASTGMRLNPLGLAATAGLGINSAVAEAYRVTVPFVAQMGWIRLRREASSSAQPAHTTAQPQADGDVDSSDLVLRDENDGTLMTIRIIERASEQSGQPMSAEQISALNPLLSNVPGLAALAELHQGNYVVCSLPFDTLTKSTSNDGSVRAFVTSGGRITEHAHLSMPDGLQNVLISGAVWNALSSAVGQKHLHDINEKLTAIKRQLDAVQNELEHQRWENLAGLLDYVQSLLDHHPQEGITDAALTVLEMRQAEMIGLTQFFERKIKEELKLAEGVEASKVFGVEASRVALQESLSRMNDWVSGHLQVSQLQVVSAALRYMAQPRELYRSAAAKALESLSQLSAKAADSRRIYGSQMELSNSLVFSLEDSKHKQFLASLDALTSTLAAGQQDTRRLHRMLFEQGEHQVLLQIENGQFTKGQLLNPDI